MDQPNDGNSSRFEEFGRKVDDRLNQAFPRAEEELKKLIAHLNDQVVPQLRRGSSQALRTAAENLSRLAEQLDRGADSGVR